MFAGVGEPDGKAVSGAETRMLQAKIWKRQQAENAGMANELRYYFCEDGETGVGPFSEEKIRELLGKDVIDGNVWLCTEGSEEWRIATDWPQFQGVERLLLVSESGAPAEVSADVPENVIHSSVLAEAFADFTTEDERAQELKRLQRAAARVDLREYRDADTEQDQVPTGDAVNKWWFLRFLRLKDFAIGAIFAVCAVLLFLYFTRQEAGDPEGAAEMPAEEMTATPPSAPPLAPATALGEGTGTPASPPPREPEIEPEPREISEPVAAAVADTDEPTAEQPPTAKVPPVAPPDTPDTEETGQGNLADSRTGAVQGALRTPEYYLLDRRFKVSTRQGTMVIAENSRVKVVNKSVDRWTVEADGLRFEVSPADLRRDNAEGVLTVGADVSEGAENAGAAAGVSRETP